MVNLDLNLEPTFQYWNYVCECVGGDRVKERIGVAGVKKVEWDATCHLLCIFRSWVKG